MGCFSMSGKGVGSLSRRRKVGTGFFTLDEATEIQQAASTATGNGSASLSASVEHICIDYLEITRQLNPSTIQDIKKAANTDSLCEAITVLALQHHEIMAK